MKKYLEQIRGKLEKLQNKFAEKYKPYGNALDKFVQTYAINKGYSYLSVSLNDSGDYTSTVIYNKFSVNFIFDYSSSHGYSFMEGYEGNKNDLSAYGLYARFKFPFSF